MRVFDNSFALSATDLANFLGCRHRTGLDMAAALGKRTRPHFDDPLLDLLIERGRKHEAAYVESLRTAGREIIDLTTVGDPPLLVAQTVAAMNAGADVIVQAGLQADRWFGKPDILRRIEVPSDLGSWSYEVDDTKLSRETRAGTILQLGLYSEILAGIQGICPEQFHVITPDPDTPKHTYRFDDYGAYFRLMKRLLEETVALGEETILAMYYPEPVEHCDICSWTVDCKHRRRDDDHLSLVAGIARLQRRELESREVRTLASLAGLPLPLGFRPRRGSVDGLTRMREQARLQLESKGLTPPLHQLRPFEDGAGLCRLPEPSPGDIFLDLEGDPVAVEGGREYLFGLVTVGAGGEPVYRSFWAFTDREEREAFEAVMDIITSTIAEHPGAHVYHYAPYEPSAFKRLMGRYATRENELDGLLRGERFVDLYRVVQQGLIAGVERYSIKNLEDCYRFVRAVDLRIAGVNRRRLEVALEGCGAGGAGILDDIRDSVEGYNRDDCISTLRLRDWLESLRTELVASGTVVSRPSPKEEAPSEQVKERTRKVAELRARLLTGVPEARAERSDEQQARWLLAYMLDWHRREDKVSWWEYFRLRDMEAEKLLDEPQAVAGLEHVERIGFVPHKTTGNPTKTVIDRYRYPAQEMEIRRGAELKLQDKQNLGKLAALDRRALTIDIEKGPKQAETHPAAVFAHTNIPPKAQEESIFALGERVAANGLTPDCAAFDLLLSRPPRLSEGEFVQGADEPMGDFAVRVGLALNRSLLAIQGPPGSGKTFTGSRMICELVTQGKRVGVTGHSHKVIRNLLDAVLAAARTTGAPVRLAHKAGDDDDDESPDIALLPTNAAAIDAIRDGTANVIGGTPWLWARSEFRDSVDVLVVDEAGQMSLANTIAVSCAATSLVLLGDPQQLEQPQKGSHPPGVDASALEHILRGHQTIPEDRGIFLPVTWRLCPKICDFTSEMFYESRLEPKTGLDRQTLVGVDGLAGSGLWIADVEHDGNRSSSDEEVEAVAELVARLTHADARWIDQNIRSRPLTLDDVLIVAPFNAHVTRLVERLGPNARVGTVDKFQGQEAPVVIYTMATSRPEDAPRGMEFLYSLNRLNVATSRARCAAIIVANRRLFEPECRTPRQMKLANALCRYRELAGTISV